MNLEFEKQQVLNEQAEQVMSEEDRKKLEEANQKMADTSNIKKQDGIVTRKRTKRDYMKLWSMFLDIEPQFKAYMGYGKEEIEKIGFKKFLDFMDWNDRDEMNRYKTDRVKALPCVHCGNHMTTFQLDFGLCENCKPLYHLDKLQTTLIAEERSNRGASFSTITAFVYIPDFRNMYLKDSPIEDIIVDAFAIDYLSGPFTRDLLLERIIGNEENENLFFLIGKATVESFDEDGDKTASNLISSRFISIRNILCSEGTIESKKKRINDIY